LTLYTKCAEEVFTLWGSSHSWNLIASARQAIPILGAVFLLWKKAAVLGQEPSGDIDPRASKAWEFEGRGFQASEQDCL